MDFLNLGGKVLYAQLGREEMRFALLGSNRELQNSHTVPTPAGVISDGDIHNGDAVIMLLKKVLRRPEFKDCRKVVFSLCTSQVITETVTTPDLPAKRLEKLLQANEDMYFPVDMKEYKLQWQVIGPKLRSGNRELQVQLWAVPKAMLVSYYEVANACNLSVARIDYCGNSIAAAVGASFARPVKAKERMKLSLNMEISFGKKKEEAQVTEEAAPAKQQTQLHVFLDHYLLGATFVQGGQVVQQRFISCGANPSYQFYELAMMVEFFGSTGFGRGSKITGFVTGGLSDDVKLVSELSEILGIELEAPAEGADPRFVLCLGAALSNLDFGVPSMDVPKNGRADSQLLQLGFVAVAGLLLIGMVVVLLTSRLSWTTQENNLKNQQQTLLIQVKKTSEYADKYDKYNSEYQKYNSDWETIFNNLRTYNDNLVLALDELEQTLPLNTDVVGLQIAPDGLTVQFACKNKEEAAYLIMALREMEFVELVGISNLSGGGGGPATSYGSGTVETPPVDGSNGNLSDRQIEILAGIMMANMDQKKMMNTFLGLSDAETDRIEKVYAKNPVNKYASLSALRGAYNSADIFQKRSNALHEMLTTNPFAVQSFVDLVKADLKAGEDAILIPFILFDLMDDKNADMQQAIMNGGLDNAEQAFGYMERLIAILTKDNATLTATEDLLATDSKTEKWYVYYLEMELGLQRKSAIGFLDMDKVTGDLMEGSFNTGDKALDAKLNALIPEAVWTALEGMKNVPGNPDPGPVTDPNPAPEAFGRADLMRMLKKYATTGKTGNTYVDQMFDAYKTDGKSGDDRWDAWLVNYAHFLRKDSWEEGKPEITKKPADYAEDALITMLFQYLSANTSGDELLDSLLDYYLVTGSTGDRDWDNWLKPYKKYLLEEGSAGSGSPGQYPVYFVVALKYKEALIKAELERKGLDYDKKIERVEVLG